MSEGRPRPVVLCVLDGFGIGADPARNALLAARMPAWDRLTAEWPTCRLEASGEAVGLPAGQMGNSEVGHLNLGAGFPVLQDLPRISQAIADGSFFDNAGAARGRRPCQSRSGSRLHLLGLIGPGGIHARRRAHRGHGRAGASAGPAARSACCSTPSPTGATRRRGRRRSSCRRWRRGWPGAPTIATGHRPLLRHGPRPPLGSDASGLGRDRPRGGAERADPRRRPSARRTSVTRATSSSSRPSSTDVRRMARRRRRRPPELPGRSGAAADAGAGAGGLRPPSTAAAGRPTCSVADPDRVPGARRAAGAGGLPAGRGRLAGGATCRASACGSCTSPRPRSTPTSPTSSTAASRRRSRRGSRPGAVQSRRADLRPGAGDERAGPITERLLDAIGSGEYDFIIVNYANPDMVGHTGVWEAAVRCRRGDRRLPRAVAAPRSARAAALRHHRRPRQHRGDARRRPARRRRSTPPRRSRSCSVAGAMPRSPAARRDAGGRGADHVRADGSAAGPQMTGPIAAHRLMR